MQPLCEGITTSGNEKRKRTSGVHRGQTEAKDWGTGVGGNSLRAVSVGPGRVSQGRRPPSQPGGVTLEIDRPGEFVG